MIIDHRTVGAFQENCWLVADPATRQAALIDPGAEGDVVLDMLHRARVELTAIWLTHAHVDHVGAVAAVKRAHDVPVYLHPRDELLYARAGMVAQMYGVPFEDPPPFDRTLADGDRLALGELTFEVMHTPGHAPGLVVFHGHGVAFAGDLLFAGSIGRTDLPFCDPAAMPESLERIMTLEDAVAVYPGHGPATTIGRERRTNPFLTGAARVLGA
ncbi:MAG TPA: MBL fold metallo-hydrolase [Gemmatimonadaceae bacterium]|nr:MBL fold metallo-hydrolase [Gemmatimonadaceae bacterium]